MTVKELIEELLKMDPTMLIRMTITSDSIGVDHDANTVR
jgi:hypothetical protein